MQFINNLLEKISAFSIERPVFLFLLFVFLMYGGMFLIALIGESRILHLWKFQSKAFFPGDLLLCFALVIAFRNWHFLENRAAYTTPVWPTILVSIVGSLSFFLTERNGDASNYPKRARYSPTKLYHDVLGYLVADFIFLVRLVPGLFIIGLDCGAVSFCKMLLFYLITFIGPYCVLVCWDMKKLNMEVLEKRHPSDWAPIWKTKKILK